MKIKILLPFVAILALSACATHQPQEKTSAHESSGAIADQLGGGGP